MLGGGGDSGGSSSSGGSPSQQLQTDQVAAAGQVPDSAFAACKTGADANKNDVCLIVGTVNSVQDYWSKQLPKYQVNYEPAKTVIYQGQTPSGCGTANSQVGPFYCPLDNKVYVDAASSRSCRASSAPTAASSPRSTSSRTSTATTSRTSSASSTAPSRTPRAPTPAPFASS